ncbi:hypothetical protein EG831_03015 [bacterium]|nr:hypothetical protein [bacterium]
MHFKGLAIGAFASVSLFGCATITSDNKQTVAVTAKTSDGREVSQAVCTLKNDKGVWQLYAPGFISVHRSGEDLVVECKKEGSRDGLLRAVSRASAAMWGNILIGGGVGAYIDHKKGNGYLYPNDLPVKMGASVTIDKGDEDHQQAAARSTDPTKQGTN